MLVAAGWRAYSDPPEVIPVGDTYDHTPGEECWCRPVWRDGVLVHHSADRREMAEEGAPN